MSSQLTVGQYNFDRNALLGRGATGTVYKGYHNTSGAAVAIKHIDMNTVSDDASRSLLQNQIKALRMVEHPNVLKMHEIVQTPGNVYIVTELLEGGTLQELLKTKGPLKEVEALTIFKDLLAGSRAVTDAGIIHRDLKPGNIMLTNNVPKIIDFGFCEIIMGGIVRAFNVGSPAYMAPEALIKTLYSQKSDSWSLGIILYEMLHGATPEGSSDVKAFLEQVRTNPGLIKDSIRNDLSSNAKQILVKTLVYNAEDRMSISGMKYQTDVFMINLKKQNSSSTGGSTQSHQTRQMTSIAQPMGNFNHILREGIKRTVSNVSQEKNSAPLVFTQLPSRKMKQNVPLVRKNQDNLQNFKGQPYEIPTQPPNMQKFYSQPGPSHSNNSSGFISYSDFTRPPSVMNKEIRASNWMSDSVSFKNNMPSSHKRNADSMINANKFIGQQNGQWQKMSRREGMERPNGQPIYRQVTVRYL